MTKSEIKQFKEKIKAAGLTQATVYTNCGVTRSWFDRMLRGEFIDPNPEWIARMNKYIDDYVALNQSYR